MTIPAELLARQLRAVFVAWGMKGDQVDITVRMLLEADLRGIDSHGIAMLPLYDDFRRAGKLTLNPQIQLVRQTPGTALLDGGGGLGHYPSYKAMNLAMEKCSAVGVGAVS